MYVLGWVVGMENFPRIMGWGLLKDNGHFFFRKIRIIIKRIIGELLDDKWMV